MAQVSTYWFIRICAMYFDLKVSDRKIPSPAKVPLIWLLFWIPNSIFYAFWGNWRIFRQERTQIGYKLGVYNYSLYEPSFLGWHQSCVVPTLPTEAWSACQELNSLARGRLWLVWPPTDASFNPGLKSHLPLSIGPMSMLNNVIPETTMNLSSAVSLGKFEQEMFWGLRLLEKNNEGAECWLWRVNDLDLDELGVRVCEPVLMDGCVYCKQRGLCTKQTSSGTSRVFLFGWKMNFHLGRFPGRYELLA